MLSALTTIRKKKKKRKKILRGKALQSRAQASRLDRHGVYSVSANI